MDDTAGIRQRQGMARGDGPMAASDFGCKPLDSCRGKEMGPASAEMLSMGQRASPKPIGYARGKMPAQAAPDHGKHR
jgi:hypothetical protein